MRKIVSIFFVGFVLTLICALIPPRTSIPWGFFGHRLINKQAVFTLPDPLFQFFKKNLEYMQEHAVDPDKRRYAVVGEAECHYIDLDIYEQDTLPLDQIFPMPWKTAIEQIGEDDLRKHGIGPWNTYFVFKKLEKAFESKDVNRILKYAAELGHYIGDMHVPLHTSSNYNGQKTGQNGIHGLWETRLPELFSANYRWDIKPAKYVAEPSDLIWKTVFESHSLVNKVLQLEDSLSGIYENKKFGYDFRGSSTVKVYSADFSKAYNLALGNMVEVRLQTAVQILGDMIFTAWVNAGQPDLSTEHGRKMDVDEPDSLRGKWKSIKIRQIEH